MQLKSLEVSGFKSFADRTLLQFVPGLTAVVGPNGSGKSNVADAIRWVLGEQSAKTLRGGHMQELIFAGSEARPPAQIAEVILTLDQCDRVLINQPSEITIMRRLYRDGDSEYAINQLPCRLKDVVELLMDTGMGQQSYAVLGQGRIDEVLSTRPEERRAIFEEAAGIVKYKVRKKEALRKLTETDANVARITDILEELLGQQAPLIEHARIATQYEQWQQQLRQYEVALIVHELTEAYDQWTRATEQQAQEQAEEVKVSTAIHVQELTVEQHALSLQQRERALEQLQTTVRTLSTGVEQANATQTLLAERIEHAHAMMQEIDIQITQVQCQSEQDHAECASLAQRKIDLENQQRCFLDQLHIQTIPFSESVDPQEEQRLKAIITETMHHLTNAQNARHHAQAHLDALERDEVKRRAQQEALLRTLQEQRDQRDASSIRCQTMALTIRQREQEIVQARIRMKQGEQEREIIEREIQEVSAKIASIQSRYQTLQELHDGYDGFATGVREVLKAAQRGALAHIHGAVASLLWVPQAYEQAIEVALGATLQHIVVQQEGAAREAIAYLKKHHYGRATFLPLDVMRRRTIAAQDVQAVSAHSGWIGIAATLVRCDPRYDDILWNVLGQLIVVEHLSCANEIARQLAYRFRIVTLEGDLVHAGGSMTGGSVRQTNTSLLARKRQLQELEQTVHQLSQQRAQQRANKQVIDQERIEIEELLRQLQEAHAMEQQLLQEAENEHKQHERRCGELSQLLETLTYEQEEQSVLRSSLDTQLAQAQVQMSALQTALIEVETKWHEVHVQREQQRLWQEQQADETATVRIELARLEEAHRAVMEQWDKKQAMMLEQQAHLQQLRYKKQVTSEQIETLLCEQTQQAEVVQQQQVQYDEQLSRLQHALQEREQEHSAFQEAQKTVKQDRGQLKLIQERLRAQEALLHRAEAVLDHGVSHLATTYELSYELARQRYPLPDTVEVVRKEVSDTKERIDLLGVVRTGAIEELARLTERIQFLTAQRDDLLLAKKNVTTLLAEIDTEMSERFLIAFTEMRAHFQELFQQMFGGGSADLQLTDPTDVLHSGIDVYAQPPGKKRQNLQLLSGGERALTAVCLLFAWLKYKPIPFCVLDEVEAALDEANVARFAQFLQQYAQNTQFIVITHRKGTMTVADVLYGVTMEQKGVSKFISVRLAQEPEKTPVAHTHRYVQSNERSENIPADMNPLLKT